MRKVKVLSVRQPWAWLIINGIKDVENRERITYHRGDLWIHVSKTWPRDFDAVLEDVRGIDPAAAGMVLDHLNELKEQCGKVIGCVSLDAVYAPKMPTMHESKLMSKWGEVGAWHWHVSHARKILNPIPARGQQGLWSWDQPPLVEFEIF